MSAEAAASWHKDGSGHGSCLATVPFDSFGVTSVVVGASRPALPPHAPKISHGVLVSAPWTGRLTTTPPRVPELPFHPQLRLLAKMPLPQTQGLWAGATAPQGAGAPHPSLWPGGRAARTRPAPSTRASGLAWAPARALSRRASGPQFEFSRETRLPGQRPLPVRPLRRTTTASAVDQTVPGARPPGGRRGPPRPRKMLAGGCPRGRGLRKQAEGCLTH